jgi:hypothetical protein
MTQKGMRDLQEMLGSKKALTKVSSGANEKPKAFYAAIDELFGHVELVTRSKIETKVLINSRRV